MNAHRLAVLLVLVLALPVVRPSGSAAQGQQDQPLKHCTSMVKEGSTKVENLRCFRTFAEAVSAATGGRVKLDKSVGPQDLTQKMLDQGVAQAQRGPSAAQTTVIGVEYWDTRYRGSSWTVYVNNDFGCRGGRSYGYTSMPSGWDNEVSSANVFGGCSVGIHFQNRNYNQNSDGSKIDCPCYTMDIMNDRTSSINWRP
jgi:hypothetical protein